MSLPLSALSSSRQNTLTSPSKLVQTKQDYTYLSPNLERMTTIMADVRAPDIETPTEDEFHDFLSAPTSPQPIFRSQDGHTVYSPRKGHSRQSSMKSAHTVQYTGDGRSPQRSPRESTVRFNEGLTQAIQDLPHPPTQDETVVQRNAQDEMMSRIYTAEKKDQNGTHTPEDETEITLSLDDKIFNDETVGDLSSISAIPADLTRFANLRTSPTKTAANEPWSPSKQLRASVVMTSPGTQRQNQRPLHLLSSSRHSNSSNEDDEATPRRPNSMMNNSPTDLLNFTGQSNIVIPPPGSAPRSTRRSPSVRGGFPIRVNPSPSHRSQASVDRERSTGPQSPQKLQQSYFPPQSIASTPAGSRRSMYGMDLLDIDLEPMATPKSIPSVTPRELETLRSELQSRISGLEATLSGKEAEVLALKRSITDAEVRVGKTSEELRNERAEKEDLHHAKDELERRSREMEDVLREVKQNAFVEEREREKLRREKEEWEHRVEEQEVKVLELTASLVTLRDQRLNGTPSPQKSSNPNMPATPNGTIDVDTAVKNATESVARELHALYKGKHERKVADLKVSYEKRWLKQVEQLRADLRASQDEVVKIQTEKDATMSGVVPGVTAKMAELTKENDQLAADKDILNAKVIGLEEQMATVQNEMATVRKELQQERTEKGELVAQVDLFLSISAQQEETKATPLSESPIPEEPHGNGNVRVASPNKSRMSLNGTLATGGGHHSTGSMGGGRPRPMSMLAKPAAGKFSGIPGPGESRLKPPAGRSGGIGTGRAGIMENIARMGAGGR